MCLLLHLALLCLSFIESAGWNHVAVCSNIMLHKLSECFLCACHSRFHKLLRYSCPLVPSFPSVSAFPFWSWARVFMCELIAASTACSSFRLWRLKSAFMYNLNYLFFLINSNLFWPVGFHVVKNRTVCTFILKGGGSGLSGNALFVLIIFPSMFWCVLCVEKDAIALQKDFF